MNSFILPIIHRTFMDEYKLVCPEEDEIRIFEIAAHHWMERLIKGGQNRRKILIQVQKNTNHPRFFIMAKQLRRKEKKETESW